jgi:predicted nucleotidyltransferase component of viral defense system
MNVEELESLFLSLRISRDAIVAEEYEMLVLRQILEHSMSRKMVFKGGTALRLAYFSRRFSEDLDFSMIKKGSEKEFKNMANVILKNVPNLTMQFALEKYYCYFARFQIHDPNLKQVFGMKLEISKRPEKLIFSVDYSNMDLYSPTVSLSLVAPVIDLKHVWSDKLDALKTRKKARDLYDKWFLAQRLNKKFVSPKGKFSRHELEEELHRFLPMSDWRIIDTLTTV